MSMSQFKVGDIVVADTKPNCIQQVTDIVWDPNFSGGNWMLKLVTIWRLDNGKLSMKKSAPVADWAFKKADYDELWDAIVKLQNVAMKVKSQ